MKKIMYSFGVIFKELIIKYLFCYLIFGLGILSVWAYNIQEPFKSCLISISASMFSLPVVFVVYTLYNKALDNKISKKVSFKLQKEINDIFCRFVYFTQFFYNKICDEMLVDEKSLNEIIRYSEEELFKKISDNVFFSAILFSDFDQFDEYVFNTINQPVNIKYIGDKELAILFDFINAYKEFKSNFRFINENDFIYYGRNEKIKITESTYASNSQGKKFYDVLVQDENGNFNNFYSAIYPLFEEEKLKYMLKLSGNKAKEISRSMEGLFKCIRRWLKEKNKEELTFDTAIAIAGRLYLDANLTINDYMQDNFSIRSSF